MPTQATPPEDLATLLECSENQVVDVLAFVTMISEPERKTTAHGERLKVDITIKDDSGSTGAAKSAFTAWFPVTRKIGAKDHLEEQKSVQSRKPVATASASEHADNSKTTLKTSRDNFTFEVCDEGTKAERLRKKANSILSLDDAQVTVVSDLPTFAY